MELDYLKSEDLDTNIQNALEHYGVKGMKWGQRQYQNPDGTYTELGKKRRRVGYGKTEKEDEKSSKNEKDLSNEKIGGKAYKDMSRKELKAARKRARHNEAERRERREFNREKDKAIKSGDLKFLAKNRDKLSDDEINYALDRYQRMKYLNNLSAQEEQENNDRSFKKALHFLEKTSQVSHVAKNIYMDVKDMQTKYQTTEEARLRNVKTRKEMENAEKDRARRIANEERDYADKRRDIQYQRDIEEDKERYKRERDKKADEIARQERIAKQDDEDTAWRRKLFTEERKWDYDVLQDRRKAAREREKWEWEKKNPNKKGKLSEDDLKDMLDNLKNNGYAFTGKPGKGKLNKRYKENKEDYDEIFKNSGMTLKEYLDRYGYVAKYNTSNKSNPKSIHDVLPITKERDERWKKDRNSGNSYKVDAWVKEMQKKYEKERNMDPAKAKEMAEEYVDAWIDFYGKQRKK